MAEVAQTACAGPVAVASPRNRKRAHVAGDLQTVTYPEPPTYIQPDVDCRLWRAVAPSEADFVAPRCIAVSEKSLFIQGILLT